MVVARLQRREEFTCAAFARARCDCARGRSRKWPERSFGFKDRPAKESRTQARAGLTQAHSPARSRMAPHIARRLRSLPKGSPSWMNGGDSNRARRTQATARIWSSASTVARSRATVLAPALREQRRNAMSKRDEYPAGVPCWVETLQPDPRAALGFYGSLLGWEFSEPGPMPGGLPGEYFVAQVEGREAASARSPTSVDRRPRRGTPTFASTAPRRPSIARRTRAAVC